jgi:hypothetical protein
MSETSWVKAQSKAAAGLSAGKIAAEIASLSASRNATGTQRIGTLECASAKAR